MSNQYSLIDGRIVREQNLGIISGQIAVEKSELESVNSPVLHYSGGHIDLSMWIDLVSFLKWSYDEHKCESQVRLFYNEQEGKWDWTPLPQYIITGLSSKEIASHKDRDDILNSFLSRGYHPFGTVHHHCSASAFQSGTDHNDEKEQPGLHITIGNLDREYEEYSFHARANFRKIFYTVDLVEWFGEEAVDWVAFPWNSNRVPEEYKKRMEERPAYTSSYDYWKDRTPRTPYTPWWNRTKEDKVKRYSYPAFPDPYDLKDEEEYWKGWAERKEATRYLPPAATTVQQEVLGLEDEDEKEAISSFIGEPAADDKYDGYYPEFKTAMELALMLKQETSLDLTLILELMIIIVQEYRLETFGDSVLLLEDIDKYGTDPAVTCDINTLLEEFLPEE